MLVKVWGAPVVGALMVVGGLWDHNPIAALLGLIVGAYGVYRIAQYLNI